MLTNNTILIETRSNYGQEALYVVSEHSQAIWALTGKKTINANDIAALKQLGFVVQEKPKEAKTF